MLRMAPPTVVFSPGVVTLTFSAVSGSPIAMAACTRWPLVRSSSISRASAWSVAASFSAVSTACRSGRFAALVARAAASSSARWRRL